MKISVVTVSYNSEDTIGRTIQSVLAQRFMADSVTKVEYLIMDGRSSDSTLKVAESYRTQLEEKGISFRTYCIRDRGIYHAMNRGIHLAGGEVIGFLNSDDWYEPTALQTVADTFAKTGCEIMYANLRIHKRNGKSFVKKARLGGYETSRKWNHPTTFARTELYRKNPFPCLGIHDDYSFFLKMKGQGCRIVTVDKVLANFSVGGITHRKGLKAAMGRCRDRYLYCYRNNGYSRWYLLECVAMELAKMILG